EFWKPGRVRVCVRILQGFVLPAHDHLDVFDESQAGSISNQSGREMMKQTQRPQSSFPWFNQHQSAAVAPITSPKFSANGYQGSSTHGKLAANNWRYQTGPRPIRIMHQCLPADPLRGFVGAEGVLLNTGTAVPGSQFQRFRAGRLVPCQALGGFKRFMPPADNSHRTGHKPPRR
ncbi:hypothetical protein BaRGS_00022836, partial [Batillaria attramentaria]